MNLLRPVANFIKRSNNKLTKDLIRKNSTINYNLIDNNSDSSNKVFAKIIYHFSTSNKNQEQENKKLKQLQKYSFQQLLAIRSTQSLTLAAKMMAQMQIQLQNVNKQINQMQLLISYYPKANQTIANKIKSLKQNVKLQQLQNHNIAKRADKQIQDTKKYAISKVAKQILEVSDNLDRSIKHSQNLCQQTQNKLKQFKKDLHKIFQEYGIQQFNPIGKQYDPNTQQSFLKLQFPKDMPQSERKLKTNKVADCSRSGYTIKGRLLRSAHVCVYQ